MHTNSQKNFSVHLPDNLALKRKYSDLLQQTAVEYGIKRAHGQLIGDFEQSYFTAYNGQYYLSPDPHGAVSKTVSVEEALQILMSPDFKEGQWVVQSTNNQEILDWQAHEVTGIFNSEEMQLDCRHKVTSVLFRPATPAETTDGIYREAKVRFPLGCLIAALNDTSKKVTMLSYDYLNVENETLYYYRDNFKAVLYKNGIWADMLSEKLFINNKFPITVSEGRIAVDTKIYTVNQLLLMLHVAEFLNFKHFVFEDCRGDEFPVTPDELRAIKSMPDLRGYSLNIGKLKLTKN